MIIGTIFKAIFGSKNERELKRLWPLVKQINELEAALQSQSADALREKTASWKAKLSAIKDNAELARAIEAVLPEAFAVVKNACRRLCGTDVTVRGHPLRWKWFLSTCNSLAAWRCTRA